MMMRPTTPYVMTLKKLSGARIHVPLLIVILLKPCNSQNLRVAWKLTLHPTRPGAIFDVVANPTVTAMVRNDASNQTVATVSVQVQDLEGKTFYTDKAEVSVPRGETRNTELSLGAAADLPHEEYLRMVVILSCGGVKQAECRKGFGFLPRRTPGGPPASSPFGLLAEGDWPLLQRLGARHVRPNWSWTERPMEWAQRYGIAYCPLMNEANAAADGRMDSEEYAAFVRESVSKFKHYVRCWQLGNEFDIFHRDGPGKYVEAQRIGYQAAKSAAPKCVVIGGSITELQVRPEGLREALQAGLAQWCDVYDFHFYQSLEVTQKMLDFIHASLKEFRAEKPIWVTETTQVGMFDPNDANQASHVFKRYTHLLANGVAIVFWHALRWPYPFEADKTQATALIDYDGFARPSLFAFAALTRELDGARFVRRWNLGSQVYALEFSVRNRSRLCLWSEGEPREITLSVSTGPVFITRPTGHRSRLSTDSRPLRVIANQEAMILDLPGAVKSEGGA